MTKIFCSTVVDTAVKTAAIVAGSEFAAQNPTLVKAVLPAAQQIMASIDAGTSQQAINGVFQLAVSELLPQLSGNPIVLAAVQGVLTSIKFTGGASPALLDAAVIKDVVDGFVTGMQTVPVAK